VSEADGDDGDDADAVPLPIDGTLDLHAFHPRDVKVLVGDYLDACRERGIFEVQIVHGKGTGALRETVHAVLARREDVRSFALAGDARGGWGATLVRLVPVAPG
jgi:DNA-nicking Smr family endonuclease